MKKIIDAIIVNGPLILVADDLLQLLLVQQIPSRTARSEAV
jgi:hypothetical protein